MEPRARLLGCAWVLCWALTGVLLLVIALRIVWHDGVWPLLLANLFTLYVFVPAYPVAVGAAVRRRWGLLAAAALVCVWHLSWALPPLVPRSPPPVAGETLRVVSANLLMVHQNPDTLAAELEAADADVMVLQEYSSRWDAAATQRGWFGLYPHHATVVRDDSFGCAIFSRVPLEGVGIVTMAGLPQLEATLELHGEAVDLLNVHTLPPRIASYVEGHHEGTKAILAWVDERGDRPFVVTGDFNSTPYSRFAAAMDDRAEDAWDLAGRGYGHTAPNGLFPLPPIRLDHIYLSRSLTVTSVEMGTGVGSDHRPLIAEVGARW
jgi:endonuclease/exonuclease/phosphatase (EEP) superfamily protein YafD